MQFGTGIQVLSTSPIGETVERILRMAEKAETLEFDSLWVADHMVSPFKIDSPYPYNDTAEFSYKPGALFLDPLAVLSALAVRTSRIKLGTGVYLPLLRHPLQTAKTVATLDGLSNGRAILGVGVGWMAEEFAVTDAPPFAKRGAAMDEYVEALRELWISPSPVYDGEFYRFSGFAFDPKPVQGSVPIWIGGNSDGALRRVARLGDGWYGLTLTPEAFAERVERIRGYCREYGTDFDRLTLSMNYGIALDRTGTAANGPEAGRVDIGQGSWKLVGTPRQIVATLRRYREAGLTHFAGYPVLHEEPVTPESTDEAFELYANEVMSALR